MRKRNTKSDRVVDTARGARDSRGRGAASPLWLLPLVALMLGLAAPARAAAALVTLADGRTVETGALKPGAAPGQLVLEPAGGAPVTVANTDLLTVEFARAASAPVIPTARLQNGDQISGRLSYPTPRQVRIAAGWGSITVPLTQLSALRFDPQAALPPPVSKDTLYFATDRVEGEVQGIANGKVTVNVGGKPVPLEIGKRVQAMALASHKAAGGSAEGGLLLAIDLGGGERLTGHWVKLTPDLLTVRTVWGEALDIPLGSISRLEVKNGKLVYLSDLKPSEAKQVPYLDGSYPFQTDRSVSGRPLRLRGRLYRRGLGTHSHSELTYSLDGGYATFAAMLGIDDAVGGAGSVIYRVYGDERLLFESPVLRGEDPPLELKLDVKRVLQLRLEVDYADGGDVADHADWADARLLRP